MTAAVDVVAGTAARSHHPTRGIRNVLATSLGDRGQLSLLPGVSVPRSTSGGSVKQVGNSGCGSTAQGLLVIVIRQATLYAFHALS